MSPAGAGRGPGRRRAGGGAGRAAGGGGHPGAAGGRTEKGLGPALRAGRPGGEGRVRGAREWRGWRRRPFLSSGLGQPRGPGRRQPPLPPGTSGREGRARPGPHGAGAGFGRGAATPTPQPDPSDAGPGSVRRPERAQPAAWVEETSPQRKEAWGRRAHRGPSPEEPGPGEGLGGRGRGGEKRAQAGTDEREPGEEGAARGAGAGPEAAGVVRVGAFPPGSFPGGWAPPSQRPSRDLAAPIPGARPSQGTGRSLRTAGPSGRVPPWSVLRGLPPRSAGHPARLPWHRGRRGPRDAERVRGASWNQRHEHGAREAAPGSDPDPQRASRPHPRLLSAVRLRDPSAGAGGGARDPAARTRPSPRARRPPQAGGAGTLRGDRGV